MEAKRIIALYSDSPMVGKTTVAQMLATRGVYRILSFASPLKEMLEALLRNCGIQNTEEYLYSPKHKNDPIPECGGKTARQLMQTLGTEWGRKTVYHNLWLKLMGTRIQRAFDAGYSVIVDDMRFRNEYESLALLGAWMVRLYRPGVEYRADHTSEGQLKSMSFDFHLSNGGSLDELAAKVDALHDVLLASEAQNQTTLMAGMITHHLMKQDVF